MNLMVLPHWSLTHRNKDHYQTMKIAFLSTRNMSRSIMAEAITRRWGAHVATAKSGASDPGDDIHPVAQRVLKEAGHSSGNLVSKSWDHLTGWSPDIVITLCDEVLKKQCPAFVGKSVHVHWSLPDPAKKFGNMEDNFNETLQILDNRIKKIFEADIKSMDKETLRAHLKKAI